MRNQQQRGAMVNFSVVAAAAWGLASGAGCGRVDPEPGVALSAAPEQIASTVCPKAYSCCTPSQLMGNDLAGTDELSCESKTAKAFRDQLAAVQDSQRAGRARYDGTRVGSCLETIRASTCETLGMTNHFTGIPGCEKFVEPLVEVGGTCFNDWECKTADASAAGRCHEGRCEALPAAGAPCADKRCAVGAVCDPNDTCVETRAEGQSCTQAVQCPSLQCTNGTCAPRAGTCFYASGCSVAGGTGAGAPAALLILAALAAAALVGRRRRWAAAAAEAASPGRAAGRS